MGAYSTLILSETGLVSYWKLNELSGTTASDSKGSNTGTYSGTYTLGVQGAIHSEFPDGWAVTLGASSIITVADSATLDLGNGPLTLEMWVKHASGTTQQLLTKGANAYLMRFSTDYLEMRMASVGSIAIATQAITDSNWHHLVCTRRLAADGTGDGNPPPANNNSVTKLYVDGVDVTPASTAITVRTLANNANTLILGVVSTSIDEAAIYNVELSADQVLNHYKTGIAGWRTQRFISRPAVSRAAVM